jgi:ATPase subunit of ABC transporter with duplicated ATPase domains
MIQLSGLTKSFGDRVLFDNVTGRSPTANAPACAVRTAPSKATLLRMMAGLDRPDSGAVLKPSALTVGYLPQDGLACRTDALRRSRQRLPGPD